MSAAHNIDSHIADKITLMAYKLAPHPTAKIMWDYIAEMTEDNYLSDSLDYADENGIDEDDPTLEAKYDAYVKTMSNDYAHDIVPFSHKWLLREMEVGYNKDGKYRCVPRLYLTGWPL